MGNLISEKLSYQINQTIFHDFPLHDFFGVRHSSLLRSEIKAHQLLCLVELGNDFFTVTQVHETGTPIPSALYIEHLP
jgi:hypothetical protein